MSSEEKKHHHRRGGRVSVDQARIEIKRWKDHLVSLGDDRPYDFVKAFFIPMDDIRHLYENYKHLDATGVRAYIGIQDSDNDKKSAPLRLLLVPAKKHTDFYNFHKVDLSGETAGENDPGGSSIYDFTMPCPDVCATTNPLDIDLDPK